MQIDIHCPIVTWSLWFMGCEVIGAKIFWIWDVKFIFNIVAIIFKMYFSLCIYLLGYGMLEIKKCGKSNMSGQNVWHVGYWNFP